MFTDRMYTGQREMSGLGIYYYNARFYDPGLGRFISPDSITPDAANPQAWNRYSYVLNNPINSTDPTGHRNCEEDDYNCINTLRSPITVTPIRPTTTPVARNTPTQTPQSTVTFAPIATQAPGTYLLQGSTWTPSQTIVPTQTATQTQTASPSPTFSANQSTPVVWPQEEGGDPILGFGQLWLGGGWEYDSKTLPRLVVDYYDSSMGPNGTEGSGVLGPLDALFGPGTDDMVTIGVTIVRKVWEPLYVIFTFNDMSNYNQVYPHP